jgi:gluconate 2-dehydrogenase gamma chain
MSQGDKPMTNPISRRHLLKAAGLAGAAGLAETSLAETSLAETSLAETSRVEARQNPASHSHQPAQPSAATSASEVLLFLNEDEARFLGAAVERLIPADAEWPGAGWAGITTFIDRQLAAGYGAGARMYLKGPWDPQAPPQQGYQLRYTPADLYRIGIHETRAHVRGAHGGREFWELGEPVMDEVLKGLESGAIALPSLPSSVFFETLLANTVEGFFADPAYGGNRDMVGWRMIGFPGAYASYIDLVDVYDLPFTRPPIAMADHVARHEHIHVNDRK